MIIWLLIAPFFFVALDSPEAFGNSPRPGPADLVLPLPGTPVSVLQLEERTHSVPDGTSTVESTEVKIYRDSSGRMRLEWRIPDASNKSTLHVTLIDPTTWSRVIL